MGISTEEAREEILGDLAAVIEKISLVVAGLTEAFELVSVQAQDRIEAELFKPAQKAFAAAQRAHGEYSERVGIPRRPFGMSSAAGLPSQGAKVFIEEAVVNAEHAGLLIGDLQGSRIFLEFGDPGLRAGLGEVRQSLEQIPGNAREFLRTLGR